MPADGRQATPGAALLESTPPVDVVPDRHADANCHADSDRLADSDRTTDVNQSPDRAADGDEAANHATDGDQAANASQPAHFCAGPTIDDERLGRSGGDHRWHPDRCRDRDSLRGEFASANAMATLTGPLHPQPVAPLGHLGAGLSKPGLVAGLELRDGRRGVVHVHARGDEEAGVAGGFQVE